MQLLTSQVYILLVFTFGATYCYLQLVPEKLEVYYAHPDYIANYTAKIRRYGRRSPYYVDGQAFIKQTLNNNVTFFVDTYEYLHNEYRLSFATMNKKLCDLVNDDMFVGFILRRVNMSCPMYPGLVRLSNLTAYWENFPYVFPISKGLLNVTLRSTATNELILGARAIMHVNQKRNKIH